MSTSEPTHRCPECSSRALRILHRRLKNSGGRMVFWWYCGTCGVEGGDQKTLADAAKNCEAK